MPQFTNPPQVPQRGDRATFSQRVDSFLRWLVTFVGQLNLFVSNLNARDAGGAATFSYTFDTANSLTDPGPGKIRFDNANQSSALTIAIDNFSDANIDIGGYVTSIQNGTSNTKGSLRIERSKSPGSWILFDISSVSDNGGFKTLSVIGRASSSPTPFSFGDSLLLYFSKNGDRGDGGNTPTQQEIRDAVGILPVSSGGTAANSPSQALANLNGVSKTELSSDNGSSLVSFLGIGSGASKYTLQDRLRQVVTVVDFGADATGSNDSTAAFQRAVDYFQSISQGYSSPFFTVQVPRGTYKILGTISVNFSNNVMQLCFESDGGTRLSGNGSNICFNFVNGGYRNIIRKIEFVNFSTDIKYSTQNRTDCQLLIDSCTGANGDTFLDTVSYAASRSTMVHIKDSFFTDIRRVVTHYTDQLTVESCWIYAKDGSLDAPFYLSGDGNVHIRDTFLIPHSNQIQPIDQARWIDFVSKPSEGTPADRSLKTLTLSNVRQSLESGRPLIWVMDTCPTLPNGNNQVSSITIEDSSCAGTAGYALVRYKQGYPGSVNLRNVKVLASSLVDVDPANTAPPVPSVPGAITQHVIMIDEATRLSQNNSNNNTAIVDPKLEAFCYDTTSQTSKYKASIRKNIDYRLRAVVAPGAGSNKVKVSLPVFFDSENSVSNRDILSFLLVTVGDAGGAIYSNTTYRAMAVTLVTIIGGDNGGPRKRVIGTVLQDAKGGLGNFTDSSAVPALFWGNGDTGNFEIVPTSNNGTEDFITAVWSASSADTAWAYIVPLAGIRANQQDKMQFNVW